MILPSTIRKLAESKSTIYRVDFAAFEFQGVKAPARSEFFATKPQAEKAIASWNIPGLTNDATIVSVVANMADHYMRT